MEEIRIYEIDVFQSLIYANSYRMYVEINFFFKFSGGMEERMRGLVRRVGGDVEVQTLGLSEESLFRLLREAVKFKGSCKAWMSRTVAWGLRNLPEGRGVTQQQLGKLLNLVWKRWARSEEAAQRTQESRSSQVI